jgi:hypothetical protein
MLIIRWMWLNNPHKYMRSVLWTRDERKHAGWIWKGWYDIRFFLHNQRISSFVTQYANGGIVVRAFSHPQKLASLTPLHRENAETRGGDDERENALSENSFLQGIVVNTT